MTPTTGDHPSRVDEFLAWERLQGLRHELIDGRVCEMSSTTLDHNTIALNCVGILRAAVRGRDCRVYSEAIKVVADGNVMYPDVMVTCAGVEPKADRVDAPILIIEVLSRSTEEVDRGRKRLAYQQLASLRQYLLVSQDQARVELHTRDEQGWRLAVITGLAATVTLEPGVTVTLAELYEASSVELGDC